MQERNSFIMDSARRAEWKYEHRFSEKLSDEDIERAWRKAYEKVGAFVMPEVRKDS